jgi:hypothetical protein
MNAELFENELFIKIKDLIQDNKRILDESIGENDYAELLSLTEKDLPDLRKLANLWLENPEKQEDRIIWDVAVIAWRSATAVNINEAVHFYPLLIKLLQTYYDFLLVLFCILFYSQSAVRQRNMDRLHVPLKPELLFSPIGATEVFCFFSCDLMIKIA